jgi:hypothetical protein
MKTDLSAVQRLAVSRALLANALQQPVWWMLVQRIVKEKRSSPAQPSPPRP